MLTSGLLSPVPADLLLRVYADGLNLNCGVIFDNIEIYPTAQPYNASIVRASRAEDPESYDGVDGLLSVAENNGQAVRAAFVLRDQLYFVKEHSIYSTRDDGVNEPADWTLSEVSNIVGTPSVDGVDTGEDWAVIADRAGLYIFDGGEPVKISQEIQPLWDTINWQYGHTLWVRVDTRAKRILVGVPIAPATQPNRVLVLDYRSLSTAADIATYASVHSSSMTGRMISVARARKWAPWNIAANAAALIERSDGTAQFFLGNGAGNGKDLSAERHAIFRRRRGHRELLHHLFLSQRGSGKRTRRASASQAFFVSDLLCRRGRELEPDFVRGQRELSHGAAFAGAEFPGKQGPGAPYQLARRTHRVSGGHESGRVVVPVVAAGRFACAGSVVASARRKLAPRESWGVREAGDTTRRQGFSLTVIFLRSRILKEKEMRQARDYKADLLNDLGNDPSYAAQYLSAAKRESKEALLIARRDVAEARPSTNRQS